MSRRFGRNRRRKMEQRIADLERAHVMDRGLLSHMRRNLDTANRALEATARALGPHFVGLTAKEMKADGDWKPKSGLPFLVAQHEPMPPARFVEAGDAPGGAHLAKAIEMYMLTPHVEFDALRQKVHIAVSWMGNSVAVESYAVSPQAMAGMELAQFLQEAVPRLLKQLHHDVQIELAPRRAG